VRPMREQKEFEEGQAMKSDEVNSYLRFPRKTMTEVTGHPPAGRRGWRPLRAVLLAFVWLNILFFFIVAKPEAQTVTYAYDELGRLVAVVEPSGNAGVLPLR